MREGVSSDGAGTAVASDSIMDTLRYVYHDQLTMCSFRRLNLVYQPSSLMEAGSVNIGPLAFTFETDNLDYMLVALHGHTC